MSPRSAETRAAIMERLENGRAEDVLSLVDAVLADLDACESASSIPVTAEALGRVMACDAVQRGEYGTAVRDTLVGLGLIPHEMAAELAGREGVPEELRTMSAQERAVWLSVERVYNAAIRAEGVDRNARTMTVFRDLVPEAAAAVVTGMIPVFQMLHPVALNPKARRDYEPETDQ